LSGLRVIPFRPHISSHRATWKKVPSTEFSLIWYTGDNYIIASSISISRCNISLRCSFVSVSIYPKGWWLLWNDDHLGVLVHCDIRSKHQGLISFN
jgi:hypothetical protein